MTSVMVFIRPGTPGQLSAGAIIAAIHDPIIVVGFFALTGMVFDLSVVAEGIEDAATADALRSAGCDRGQGWHYSKPLPPDAFASWALERAALWSTPRAPIEPIEPA